jgi:hypothetical protein
VPEIWTLGGITHETYNCTISCLFEHRFMFASDVCEGSCQPSRLDDFRSSYWVVMLFFRFISYVEIKRCIQPEKFGRQAGVFAGVFCRTAFGILFGDLDVKISSKTLTMPPDKAPESTALGAFPPSLRYGATSRSGVAVRVPIRRWLSFL